jgi:hypothetical protein
MASVALRYEIGDVGVPLLQIESWHWERQGIARGFTRRALALA